MDVLIERFSGEKTLLSDVGIMTLDFRVPSPKYNRPREQVIGRPGSIGQVADIEPREITGVFCLKAGSMETYATERDEVFNLFRSNEYFFIYDMRIPEKRWLVVADDSYDFDQQRMYGFFEVKFIADNPPYSMATFRTDEHDFMEKLYNSDVLSRFVLDKPIQYVFYNETDLWVFNAGNVEIDSRYMDLDISFIGASNQLKITNKSILDPFGQPIYWQYYGSSNPNDLILITGIRSFKQGASIFRDTSRYYIRLKPGWNNITISGASNFEIAFGFRYHYL
ncbi:hypothetical protein bcgnr5383_52260 [Bacillus cereus]|uniref:phage tail domain-containing protein n=1 Tax=Bacillus cereus TaxID=1396 RepID=UPI00062D0B6C|nr:phage tail domain-containing protein [Bacillus cereus]KLA35597.1 hypothetical protein B4080_5863 [Bacillus cereus]